MTHIQSVDTISDAKKLLAALPAATQTETIPLKSALGRISAEDLTAKIAVPSFNKSAFDGYALNRADIIGASHKNPVTLRVTEIIAAGDVPAHPVGGGTAARIMTGAQVPPGADVVIKHEDTEFTGDTVTFFKPAGKGSNIAKAGEDVIEGARLINSGTMLCAPEVAAFAAQGRERVKVYKKPEVVVISTGSELVAPGNPLNPGKIYNSNGPLIRGYLEAYGIEAKDGGTAPDDIDILTNSLNSAFNSSDAVITTGGVSAGDYDYIEKAALKAGARLLFHKLPFKPGGAILAAEKGGKLLLGLSGNPSAAATGLLLLGLPYLKRLCGLSNTEFLESRAALDAPFSKPSKNLRLLWGKKRINHDGSLVFCVSDTQRNGAVSSMLGCDLLGAIPAGSGALPAGTPIKVYLL